jgi:hypothetical protein
MPDEPRNLAELAGRTSERHLPGISDAMGFVCLSDPSHLRHRPPVRRQDIS